MLISNLLLWSDRVIRSIFKEIVDVVVVDLNVGNKHTVTTVFIHILRFTGLIWADHICKFRVRLLPKKEKKEEKVKSNLTMKCKL